MSDIEIEIDGKPLTAKPNTMVIQVADEAGIYIPRFCYHKHLSIAANCRMCLVEVEKSPKALPACATPIMPGMKIFTRSPKALAAQKAVMEFLLINHPLDCPICDQGGECELQDLSMGFGSADSFYTFGKRSVKDEDLGPLIATDMTRCIQCTRCVRFGDEIAGLRELGATGRGEKMEIGTYISHALQSEISGNIIDLCPVGALTSKPFRFTARAWELNQYPSIAPHDCVGSNIYVHTRNGKVMRVVPRENLDINQTWISDRDRFSYEALEHPDRLENPMIRVDDQWQETDWQTALEVAVKGLQDVIHTQGAEHLAALASPNSTVEEFYLLQKLLRQLGSSNIDHRLRQVDFSDQHSMPTFPGLNGMLADIENCDAILLIGSNIQQEQPLAGLRVRQAARKGARVMAVNMLDYRFNFKLAAKKIAAPHLLTEELANVLQALTEKQSDSIADLLREGKKVCVLLGASAFNHPEAAALRALASAIAKECNAMVGYLTEGGNAAGAWLAGAVPHRQAAGDSLQSPGLNANEMWKNPRKAYVLLNVEPEFDCANAPLAQNALRQAQFVVSLAMYKNPMLAQYANVILPITPFTETAGTFINLTGEWQKFTGVAPSLGEARPAWKVLRVLGNLFHCEGFDYESAHEISEELRAALNSKNITSQTNVVEGHLPSRENTTKKISRVGEIPLYAGDSLQRRAKALQATQPIIENNLIAAHLHPETAAALNVTDTDSVSVTQDERRVVLPVVLDKRVPLYAAYIPGGILATHELSQLYGPIEIQKA
jgi:NADH-quinone oxidoreductase subunit G